MAHEAPTRRGGATIDSAPPAEEDRYTEIDALKAIGILTVVLIHSVPLPWHEPQTPGEGWLLATTRFAVPSFLFASGFLYATRNNVPSATTWRRLRRVLLPYLVASAVAQLRRFFMGGPISLDTVSYDLLTGSSLNPYYYVFVIFSLILLAPALARLPDRPLLLALSFLLASQVADELGFFDLTEAWAWRNPLRWGAYFVLGWVVRLHYEKWNRRLRLTQWRVGIMSTSILIVAWIAMATLDEPLAGFIAWVHTYAMISGIIGLTGAQRWRSKTFEWLSVASYAIFLFHLYFIWMASEMIALWIPTEVYSGDGGRWVSVAARWSAGMGGSLALVAIARRCAGGGSRKWIGA